MNTAYNTTNVQESRNRYNTLLAQALKRINDRKRSKTAQEPEEVTTATPENVTTEPTEESKPEEETTTRKTTKTRRTKTTSPKPLGRDIYHIFYEKQSRWAIMFDKSVYHNPEGYALLSDNVVLIESKLDYKEEYSGKLIQEDGTESKKDMQLFSKYYKDICRPAGGKYAVTPKEIEERIKGEEFARKKRVICSILESDDVTDEEVKIHLKNNKDVRDYVNEQTKTQFVKLLLPAGESVYLYIRHIKRALKVAKTLSTNCISTANRIFQFTGEAGRIIVAGCITRPEDESSMNPLIIDLTDATLAPEDTPAIEEATPATAPQPTEEDTATAPEEVTTAPEATAETPVQEPEEVTTEEATAPADTEEEEKRKRREADYITVLKYCVEHYGEVGADYLDTLDYTQATEQVYTTKRGNSTKVTERFYSIDGRTIYGLHRRYNKNGKRAKFVVFKDGQIIEERTYGKNNNSYKAEVKRNDGSIRYQVEDGKVTRAEYLRTKKDIKPLSVEFDDNNRPATPRDLPAPAPTKTTSKETTKEATATTVQEQPTSKQVPTPEATPAPEEVTTVTTSNQENGPVPYWLLLDNELRAQQEEQEQETTPATPEKSEEEPAPATEATEDPEEVVFLKGAELDKVIEEYADKNGLDLKEQKRYYDFYATPGGYLAMLSKPEIKRYLYIADEGPYYEKYQKGAVTDKDVFLSNNMQSIRRHKQMLVYTPEKGKTECDLFVTICSNSDNTYIEMPNRQTSPREVAVYEAVHRLYISDQRARLEKYWKRYSDKVWVDTYWADR